MICKQFKCIQNNNIYPKLISIALYSVHIYIFHSIISFKYLHINKQIYIVLWVCKQNNGEEGNLPANIANLFSFFRINADVCFLTQNERTRRKRASI